jgi:DNA-binding MarR family transcriptional regulator
MIIAFFQQFPFGKEMASTPDDLITDLLILASRFQKSNRRLARSLLLSVNELHCILILALERPCCVRKLAESLDTSLTGTSKTLLSLEKRGLIERKIDPGDHRKERVTLTEPGKAVYTRVRTEQLPAARRILDSVPVRELPVFFALRQSMLTAETGDDAARLNAGNSKAALSCT